MRPRARAPSALAEQLCSLVLFSPLYSRGTEDEPGISRSTIGDHKSLAGIRAATEARALLLRPGIKLPAAQGDFLTGSIKLWECADGSKVVGHCSGDVATGDVLSLSVHPGYEGRGIGREGASVPRCRLATRSRTQENLAPRTSGSLAARLRLLSCDGVAANRRTIRNR